MAVKFNIFDENDNLLINDKKDTCIIVGTEDSIFNIPADVKIVTILNCAMVYYNAISFMKDVANKIEEISGINPEKFTISEFAEEYKKIVFKDISMVENLIEKGEKNVENRKS